jgi:hypothetical protein
VLAQRGEIARELALGDIARQFEQSAQTAMPKHGIRNHITDRTEHEALQKEAVKVVAMVAQQHKRPGRQAAAALRALYIVGDAQVQSKRNMVQRQEGISYDVPESI